VVPAPSILQSGGSEIIHPPQTPFPPPGPAPPPRASTTGPPPSRPAGVCGSQAAQAGSSYGGGEGRGRGLPHRGRLAGRRGHTNSGTLNLWPHLQRSRDGVHCTVQVYCTMYMVHCILVL
jgi:hypothetical protein